MFEEKKPTPHGLKHYFQIRRLPQVNLAATLRIPTSTLTAYLAGYFSCPRDVETRLVDYALDLEDREPEPDSLAFLRDFLESRIREPLDRQLSLHIDRLNKIIDEHGSVETVALSAKPDRCNRKVQDGK